MSISHAEMRNTIPDQNFPNINMYMNLGSCTNVDFDWQVQGELDIHHLKLAPTEY